MKGGLEFDPDRYAPVAERITMFYRAYPTGRIVTELMNRTEQDVVFRASVYRDTHDLAPAATGWAAEREGDGDVNEVACLENTETSAIGRALANLGFTASKRRPSAEEMAKAARVRRRAQSRSEKPLQAAANAAFDVLAVLATCQRYGFSARRAAIIHARLTGSDILSLPEMYHVEQKLRAWMRCRPV